MTQTQFETLMLAIGGLDTKLSGKIDKLEGRFDKLEGRFDKLESKVDAISRKLDMTYDQTVLITEDLATTKLRVAKLEGPQA